MILSSDAERPYVYNLILFVSEVQSHEHSN